MIYLICILSTNHIASKRINYYQTFYCHVLIMQFLQSIFGMLYLEAFFLVFYEELLYSSCDMFIQPLFSLLCSFEMSRCKAKFCKAIQCVCTCIMSSFVYLHSLHYMNHFIYSYTMCNC